MKKIWISSLIRDENLVKGLISQLKTYGLEASGHFWEDDLEKLAWMKVREELIKKEIALWALLTTDEMMKEEDLRYGLSLLAITLQAEKGMDFPVFILQTEGEPISPETLPTPLKGVQVISASGAAFGAKLVAKMHSTGKEDSAAEYRMDLYGNEQIGQWFEVGPKGGIWSGGIFGVEGAEIAFHGVGPKGKLPDKSTLNYPMEGMKLSLGETEYTAWAVQNELDSETSYFLKVKGAPESVLFGPYSEAGDAEVYVVALK
ncbi:MAG: hypothetical protein JRF28_04080 [Deltaproteobacteria bacterium]|nr:hypothetical protein [Deltaproteobacteria bacterium]MBW2318362.1 hypothetical protein [Deltaproteobacteria bacterium]OEU45060.1 MAG: hypothetical protein BBJ60_09410 [Desulfobacterales bacterium S7086C20]